MLPARRRSIVAAFRADRSGCGNGGDAAKACDADSPMRG
ncbi:hypothetical protein C7S16_5458 [Burkholderia thailandensis]|uniref:Uncharacterized protein n=1 Tax=Burkholderia thailandensis TaxID=57975 RepID=A0AAW9CKM7_BURTH|nr:hypothetical protein [Burkholderia thailandensis]MDW9251408.1 hypothetical protein [Burkholderia thailandensis]